MDELFNKFIDELLFAIDKCRIEEKKYNSRGTQFGYDMAENYRVRNQGLIYALQLAFEVLDGENS